jgi:hypothetical protein
MGTLTFQAGTRAAATAGGTSTIAGMFVFFSNRTGCLGSIVISVIASVVLILLIRGCSGGTVTTL